MKEKSFEQALARLEEISALLESGQQTLDESIKLFEEVNELAGFCQDKLDKAEQKLSILVKEEGSLGTVESNLE